MAGYMDFIRSCFPGMEEEYVQYVEGILESSINDLVSADEIYDAIGDVLRQVDDTKSDLDIKRFCNILCERMKPDDLYDLANGNTRILDAPVHIGSSVAGIENDFNDMNNIWVLQKDCSLKVDPKKLAKAKAKLEQKQNRRDGQKPCDNNCVIFDMRTATASQVTSKKDAKLEAKGLNRSSDIRIENFDVSFGDKVLLKNADLALSYGRRYGLVGRNGLGKTTLLRLISSGQLHIPSHISILHVEQEVVGDDTPALQSVLHCDILRTRLLEKEKQLTAKLATTQDNNSSAELNEIYAALEAIEADKAPARASVILDGLGFNSEMQRRPTKEFSGGWRMRLALARALFSKPDLLLLDEPTNMLDMKAIIWLENYLQKWPKTILVVSHDRLFLDKVPTDILHFHSQRIDSYRGNYELFEKSKTERLKNQQRELDAQVAQRAHIQEFIDKFRYNANRASSVQSKVKMLEKMPELTPIEKETEVSFKFPETEKLSPPIIQLDEVSFKYSPNTDLVLTGVNLNANLQSRICIVGDNGAGKTTLLKLIMGILQPTKGTVHVHRNLRFGYFSQHHVDQLEMNVSSVELLQSTAPGRTVEEYRRLLGGFGVCGDLPLQPVGTLSGGQKSRVAFSRMCLNVPNFLVLDEPTNHLDIATIEALGRAITDYQGGIILVSHDERLIRKVCRELWICSDKTVKSIEGGFDEYRMIVEKELAEVSK